MWVWVDFHGVIVECGCHGFAFNGVLLILLKEISKENDWAKVFNAHHSFFVNKIGKKCVFMQILSHSNGGSVNSTQPYAYQI
jgi:hypothetical protein